MVMYLRGRYNEGIQIIRTLPFSIESPAMTNHHLCGKGGKGPYSSCANLYDPSAALLLEAIRNHEYLIKSKARHSFSLNTVTKQHTIALYQRASVNASSLYIKIIADNNIAQILHVDHKYHLALSALVQANANLRLAKELYGDCRSSESFSELSERRCVIISEEISIPVMSNLGYIHCVLGEFERALQCVKSALEEDISQNSTISASLWFNFGILQQNLLSKKTGVRCSADVLNAFQRALRILENDYIPGSGRNRDIVTIQVEILLLQAATTTTTNR